MCQSLSENIYNSAFDPIKVQDCISSRKIDILNDWVLLWNLLTES
jgi:hypothetical protein